MYTSTATIFFIPLSCPWLWTFLSAVLESFHPHLKPSLLDLLALLWFYLLIAPLYFNCSTPTTPLHPSPLHSDMLASLGYAHYNFPRLVFLHLNSLHFYWICSPPSYQIWPIHYSCSVSALINSDIFTLSHSSLHCLLGLALSAWLCLSLLETLYFPLK